MLRLLLAAGGIANRYQCGMVGMTALHVAAQFGHAALIAPLLAAGGGADSQMRSTGQTALVVAVQNMANADNEDGKLAVVQALLKGGADPAATDHASAGESKRIAEEGYTIPVLFFAAGLNTGPEAHAFTKVSNVLVSALVKLLKARLRANGNQSIDKRQEFPGSIHPQRDEDGYTLLMSDCYHGRACEVMVMIAAGADVNRTSERGQTPLMVTCKDYGHKQQLTIMRLLIEAGANVNLVDDTGKSAGEYAAKAVDAKNVEMLRMLNEHSEKNEMMRAAETGGGWGSANSS